MSTLYATKKIEAKTRNAAAIQTATIALHAIRIVLVPYQWNVLKFCEGQDGLPVTLAIVRENRSSSVLPSQNRTAVVLIIKWGGIDLEMQGVMSSAEGPGNRADKGAKVGLLVFSTYQQGQDDNS